MFSWSGIPFTRFTIALSLGILVSFFALPTVNYLLPAGIALTLYLILFYLQRINRKFSYPLRPVLGITGLITLFFAGALLLQMKDERFHSNHLINQKENILYYQALITSVPETKEKSYKVEAEIIQIKGKTWKGSEGKVILYLSKENYHSVNYGDEILIRGMPSEIKSPMNPGEFNYKEYARRHHFYHSHFLKTNDYHLISSGNGNPVFEFAFTLRSNAQKILQKYIPGTTEQGIATALILGLKGTMDQELMDVYSATGTTHVLAVSGLHVAIVFQILVTVFFFFKSSRSKNTILPIVLLAGLWLYVLVTGLCPSVLRAGVMFSTILIAKALKRNHNTFNTLFFSAFFLLCYDPFMILDTGFQLSYLAVFGVVYFTDSIYRLIEIDNYILDKIWMTSSMSLAAQITTLPITIYYFHQIPLSFLIANLIAIPVSSIILYSGTILLCVSFTDAGGHTLGYITDKLIWLMNKALYYISELPFASLKGLSFTISEALLIYSAILITTLFLSLKKIIYLRFLAATISLLVILFIAKNIQTKNQQRFIVFNIPNEMALAFIKGEQAYIYSDSLDITSKKFNRYIKPYLEERNISEIKLNKENSFVNKASKNGVTIFTFLNKNFMYLNDERKVKTSIPYTDFAVIHPKAKINYSDIKSENKIILNTYRNKSFRCSEGDCDLKVQPAFEVLF